MLKTSSKESILLYNIKGKDYAPKLKSILLKQGIRIKVVEPEQYTLPIHQLLSAAKDTALQPSPEPNEPFTDEMMVMASLSNAKLNLFLTELRKQGIRIPLKAILTPHNSNWTSFQLHDELVREHQKMMELEEENKKNQ